MSTTPTKVQAEVADLRDALDHIQRVASASRTKTKRLHWIAERARCALDGSDWRDMPEPPTKSEKIRDLRHRLEFLERQEQRQAADFLVDDNNEGSTPD